MIMVITTATLVLAGLVAGIAEGQFHGMAGTAAIYVWGRPPTVLVIFSARLMPLSPTSFSGLPADGATLLRVEALGSGFPAAAREPLGVVGHRRSLCRFPALGFPRLPCLGHHVLRVSEADECSGNGNVSMDLPARVRLTIRNAMLRSKHISLTPRTRP